MRRFGFLSAVALGLGVVSLFLEQAELSSAWAILFTGIVDYAVLVLTVLEVILSMARAPVLRNYVRRNVPSLVFVLVFVALFIYNKATPITEASRAGYLTILIVRNLFLLLKVFTRLRKLSEFISGIVSHPAQTIVLSFLLVIVIGTLVLMMPFTTISGRGLGFVEAFFTTTSAVCVTGLVVVDTATVFTVWGQIVIVILIQIGGLGIMILSFFTIFVFRQSVSVENKLLLSYVLSEDNMGQLSSALRRIIVITFGIEALGAALLYPMFIPFSDGVGQALLYALFHAVSAFCNAGFALFSDSLEGFVSRPGINLVISGLIIAGGLSFGVISNSARLIQNRVSGIFGRRSRSVHLTVNTRVVLAATFLLLAGGMLLFYGLEHGRSMAALPTGTQYLAAFFQSVTLRTAGFNSVSMSGLATATYLVMIVIMFIGGASGSTAGGIKVNTVAVLAGYLSSLRKGRRQAVVFRHAVSESQVATAFTVLLFGGISVVVATVAISLTDNFGLTETLFESVSAFATVGLSTGITAGLSTAGRLVIVILMFIGRVGPLTLFSALSGRPEQARISYPTADISVG